MLGQRKRPTRPGRNSLSTIEWLLTTAAGRVALVTGLCLLAVGCVHLFWWHKANNQVWHTIQVDTVGDMELAQRFGGHAVVGRLLNKDTSSSFISAEAKNRGESFYEGDEVVTRNLVREAALRKRIEELQQGLVVDDGKDKNENVDEGGNERPAQEPEQAQDDTASEKGAEEADKEFEKEQDEEEVVEVVGRPLITPGLDYWRAHQEARKSRPSDPSFVPGKPSQSQEKFLVFHTWSGGLNNERMSLEVAYAMARATNRTLVLPPKFQLYLSGFTGLEDYYCPDDMKRGVRLAHHEEMAKKLGWVDVPDFMKDEEKFKSQEEVFTFEWKFELMDKVLCSPDRPTEENGASAEELQRFSDFKGPHVSSHFDAMGPEFQDPTVIYFPRFVLLHHFYAFIYYRDPAIYRQEARVIRDFVHYTPKIVEFASRVINAVLDHVEERRAEGGAATDPNSPGVGPIGYSAMHLRRGDFQYKEEAQLDPQKMYDHHHERLTEGQVLYIATDEKKHDEEFKALAEHYDLLYLDQFMHLLDGVPKYYLGPIDQLVCSYATRFIGTRLSTFTGYIYRVRGYQGDHDNKDLDMYFTSRTEGDDPTERGSGEDRFHWRSRKWRGTIWGREFKDSWFDIDER